MPGLVRVAVSTELLGETREGVEEGGDRRPYHWASCWIIPPSMPSSLPPHKWPGSSDNHSLSPLPGQLLCFLDTLRVTQLTQKKTLTISFWISAATWNIWDFSVIFFFKK